MLIGGGGLIKDEYARNQRTERSLCVNPTAELKRGSDRVSKLISSGYGSEYDTRFIWRGMNGLDADSHHNVDGKCMVSRYNTRSIASIQET